MRSALPLLLAGCVMVEHGLAPRATAEEALVCADFRPTAEELRRFARYAEPVSVHEADWAPCVSHAVLDGVRVDLNALWSGTRTDTDGGVVFLRCGPACVSAVQR